jgi:CRISPR-associated protein Csm1
MFTTDFKALQEAVSSAKKLYSIFDRVSLGHSSGRLNNQHLPRPLTNENIVSAGESYSKDDLLTGLEKDLKRWKDLNIDNDEVQTDTFYYLLQKYGWRIADPQKEEETSLAVAYCDSFRVKKVLDNTEDGKGFILLKGDLSGIQKYIYGNIQPKRAGGMVNIAKKLRGRSVLVSLLSDFLANVVLRELDLPVWHLMFAGGGHFNLLLPDNAKTYDGLEKLIPKLDSEMRDRFGDNLQLVIAKKAFSKDEIINDIGACFAKINIELERQKLREHFNNLHDRFYPAQEEIDIKETKKKQFEEWEVQIGERFPRQKILIEAVTNGSFFERHEMPELFTIQLLNHSYSLMIVESYGVAGDLLSEVSGLVSAQVLLINDTNFLPETGPWSNKISFGFRFLGKTVPTTEDTKSGRERPKTFEEIVNSDELKMLAAMRLDVDDLGFIFSRGIKGATLGEIVTLSREMQYFFAAHFDQLAAQQKYDLYVIYSGGDDAFVAGKWDNLIAFAQQLHQDFQAFVFGNEDLHFSAGIFMGNPHYPIGKISQDAEKLQKASKDSNDRKNRVSIFNHIMSWTSFDSKIELGIIFEEALETKKIKPELELVADQMLSPNENRGKLNSAFAYRILQLVKTSFYERSGVDSSGQRYARGSLDIRRFARNVENMRYLFARHGFDRKRSEAIVGKLETALIGDFLKSFDFGTDAQIKSTRDYLVALNYALFKQRSKNKTNQNHE